MKNIWEKIKAFFCAADKQLRILACYAIAMTVFVGLLPFIYEGKKVWWCFVIAIAASAVAGALKEWYNHKHPKGHDFEVAGIVADALGILLAIGAMLFYLLN